MILRPALIGLTLSAIVIMLLILPKEMSEDGVNTLPPRLFPMFTEERAENIRLLGPMIEVHKTPLHGEVIPGNTVAFTLSVKNISQRALANLTAEERFDETRFNVLDAGEGAITQNRLSWKISMLQIGEQWKVSYILRTVEELTPEPLQTTSYIYGKDLRNMTSAGRMISSNISIITLPDAGVELGVFLKMMKWVLE